MGPKGLKRFGLEAVFFCIVIPLFVLFAVVYAAIGIFLLICAPFARAIAGRWVKFFTEPWSCIASVGGVIKKHLVYIYKCDYVPWRDKRRAKQAEEAARKQAHAEPQVSIPRAAQTPRPSPRYDRAYYDSVDTVDVITALQLMYHMGVTVYVFVHFLITLIGTISVWGAGHVLNKPEMPETIAPAPTVTFQPQVADKQEADYGPWLDAGEVFDERRETDFLNIALISDTGSVKYSRRLMGSPKGFEPTSGNDKVIRHEKTGSGQVKFKDERQNSFTVNPKQAFLFEGYKSRVFMFSPEGKLLMIATKNFKTTELKGDGS